MSLRTFWGLLSILLVAVVAVVMMASIATIEKKAWVESEDQQAKLLLTMLSNELKMPMVAVSSQEVDASIAMFRHEVPGVSVFLRWATGHTEKFGDGVIPAAVESLASLPAKPAPVAGQSKWYSMGIKYNATQLGTISVYLPGKSWRENDTQIKMRLTATAAAMALLAALLVYGMSGRMVNQLRLLARASKRVGSGDFAVHLPIVSSNEFGKAFHQFNKMVAHLEQREKVYDLYGSYQRPQLVADEYDRNTKRNDAITREVSVLVVDMIGFNAYREQAGDADVMAVLNQYFALFQKVVQAFDGHVDHIIGDKMIAVFNHPFVLKCHENQAAKAGLAMIAANQKMAAGDMAAGAIVFRVGMAIGDVTVGHLGVGRRKDFTIVGAPLTLAAQLAKLGDGTSLTAPYGTMLSLGHGYKQRDLGQQQLSGGREIRCIHILPGEAYVSQEIEAVVAKAFQQIEPEDLYEDEGW